MKGGFTLIAIVAIIKVAVLFPGAAFGALERNGIYRVAFISAKDTPNGIKAVFEFDALFTMNSNMLFVYAQGSSPLISRNGFPVEASLDLINNAGFGIHVHNVEEEKVTKGVDGVVRVWIPLGGYSVVDDHVLQPQSPVHLVCTYFE